MVALLVKLAPTIEMQNKTRTQTKDKADTAYKIARDTSRTQSKTPECSKANDAAKLCTNERIGARMHYRIKLNKEGALDV